MLQIVSPVNVFAVSVFAFVTTWSTGISIKSISFIKHKSHIFILFFIMCFFLLLLLLLLFFSCNLLL
ncbi:hypothetical protein cypCar_00028030 [Cyprinus carpio]|nr:hypothetical protein cypCar_00028030 [Cyprinus carpio]